MGIKAPRILIVDDDTTILTSVQEILRNHGFEITTTQSGEEALATILRYPLDLVVLDVMLPGISGLDVCKSVREHVSRQLPIIMISVKGNEAAKGKALRMGANDYITKPFNITTLEARLNAYLRDPQKVQPIFNDGPLTILFSQRRVLVNKQEVQLTPNEYSVLEILVNNRGRLVTPETLVCALWSEEYGSYARERDIVVLIHNLRKKIERSAQHQFIITHHHLGYRFKLDA